MYPFVISSDGLTAPLGSKNGHPTRQDQMPVSCMAVQNS